MILQMKREALEKLIRHASESGLVLAQFGLFPGLLVPAVLVKMS
jgi:hypothetical protein